MVLLSMDQLVAIYIIGVTALTSVLGVFFLPYGRYQGDSEDEDAILDMLPLQWP